MSDSRVLVITGMHRSGTSLITSMLELAGVMVGEQLLEPNAGNLRGYFEDVDFYTFHEEILCRHGEDVLVQDTDVLRRALRPPQEADVERAEELIAARADNALWGWKDPRTALFLDFWDERLSDARYLFIYRHPVDVMLSLRRRGVDFDAQADPMIGLQAWKGYNRCILEFYRRNAGRCLLVDLYGAVEDAAAFVRKAAEKLDLEFFPADVDRLFVSEELNRCRDSEQVAAILRRIDPRTDYLLKELEAETDISQRRPAAVEEPRHAVLESLLGMADACLGEETRPAFAGPVLSLLLAALDPALAGPDSLRQPLLSHLRGLRARNLALTAELEGLSDLLNRLEAERRERQQRSAQQHEALVARASRTDELEGRLEQQSRQVLELRRKSEEDALWALQLAARVAEGEATESELRAEIARRGQVIDELEIKASEQQGRLSELRAERRWRQETIDYLRARLAEHQDARPEGFDAAVRDVEGGSEAAGSR